jgi:protein SCO1
MMRSSFKPAVVILAAVLVPLGRSNAHTLEPNADWKNIGVEEKLGQKVNLDASFLDEHGKPFVFKNALDRPMLVLPIYYSCPESCGLLLANLAATLNRVTVSPSRDFRVVSLSIDEEDDPAAALRAKKSYSRILTKNFPEDSWKYLVGNDENIHLATDSLGYQFKETKPHEFIHPNVLIVLAADGTIIRYLYGPEFLPFDIGMALTEAQRGTPSLSIRKLVSYCFSYDPAQKTYVFSSIKYFIAGTVALLGVLLFFLLRRKEAN